MQLAMGRECFNDVGVTNFAYRHITKLDDPSWTMLTEHVPRGDDRLPPPPLCPAPLACRCCLRLV
jgi:hypothetical protein